CRESGGKAKSRSAHVFRTIPVETNYGPAPRKDAARSQLTPCQKRATYRSSPTTRAAAAHRMSDPQTKRNDPNHIGIIMDGNGRWAKERGYSRPRGHREGAKTCRKIIDACQELGVRYLTLYAFSAENWSRPSFEVRALMELLEIFLDRETKTMI